MELGSVASRLQQQQHHHHHHPPATVQHEFFSGRLTLTVDRGAELPHFALSSVLCCVSFCGAHRHLGSTSIPFKRIEKQTTSRPWRLWHLRLFSYITFVLIVYLPTCRPFLHLQIPVEPLVYHLLFSARCNIAARLCRCTLGPGLFHKMDAI